MGVERENYWRLYYELVQMLDINYVSKSERRRRMKKKKAANNRYVVLQLEYRAVRR